MKCLHIFRVLNSTSGISCYRAIHTDGVMFARNRTRNVPRKINYEPGLRRAEATWPENSDVPDIQNEEDLEHSSEFMNFDQEYDEAEDEKRQRQRLGYIITAKKFFKDPPNPATLSWNERECIRYLHKTDPIQWNIKALSESFPATPDAIRKVLRVKFKITEERKKKMDLKVQKNWQLLSEGRLQAAPEVLEHLKKFINRREVLLEQIKKADFYLPEVKEEVVWNNGEMSKILVHYEKAIERLALKQEKPQKQKMLSDDSHLSSGKIKKQIDVCASSERSEKLLLEDPSDSRTEFTFPNELMNEKISCSVRDKTKAEEMKNSEEKPDIEKFMLKDVKGKYSSPDSRTELAFSNELMKEKVSCSDRDKTMAEEMKNSEEKPDIEKFMLKDVKGKYSSPDSRTELAFSNELMKEKVSCSDRDKTMAEEMKNSEEKPDIEKFMLKDVKGKYSSPDSRTEFAFLNELMKEKISCSVRDKAKAEDSSSVMKKSEEKTGIEKFMSKDVKKKYSSPDNRRELVLKDVNKKSNSPDNRTEFAFPNEFKKVLCEVSVKTEAEGSSAMKGYEEKKSDIERSGNKNFYDPERLRLEDEYYTKQVKDIENTAFWNNGRTSQDKALAEREKMSLGGPDVPGRGNICSSDVYPERIKIPRDKRGSGLTFRVKDCYYDDDGEFLYRVPGMVK